MRTTMTTPVQAQPRAPPRSRNNRDSALRHRAISIIVALLWVFPLAATLPIAAEAQSWWEKAIQKGERIIDHTIDQIGQPSKEKQEQQTDAETEPPPDPPPATADAPSPEQDRESTVDVPPPAQAPTSTANVSQPPAYPADQVREVQRLLTELGYKPGPVDGTYGSGTADAIRAFQRDQGRPVDGRVNKMLVRLLSVAAFKAEHEAKQAEPSSAVSTPTAGMEPGVSRETNEPSIAEKAGEPAGGTGTSGSMVAPAPAGAEAVSAPFENVLLQPEGLRMGMPLLRAKAHLKALGYSEGSGCRFERAGSHGGSRTEIRLSFDFSASPLAGTARSMRLQQLQPNCADSQEDGLVVAGLSYKQIDRKAARTIDPQREIERLVEKLGPYASCGKLLKNAANACLWNAPPDDPAIKSVTVSVNTSWGRQVTLKGDMLEIAPPEPERVKHAEVMEKQALSICESGDRDSLFRVLHDCGCIAKKVGKAYAVGRISEVTASTLGAYKDNCPAPKEQLQAHFEENCFKTYGNRSGEWARSGGCRCVGEKGANLYLADPRAFMPHLTGIGASSATQCGQYGGGSPTVPENYRISDAESQLEADYQAVGEAPSGFRPLEMWLIEGRPVIHKKHYMPLTGPDAAFDYRPQERALTRYLNLLVLQGEPNLMTEEVEASRVLAGENLQDALRDKLMIGCQIDYSAAATCKWAGSNEFEQRASKQTFLEQFAATLKTIGQPLPREFIYVESAQLGDYDPGRGGFPVIVAGDQSLTDRRVETLVLSNESLFGYSGLLQAVLSPATQYPDLWSLEQADAEAVLSHLAKQTGGKSRTVAMAWIFKIVTIEVPQGQYVRSKRDVVVQPVAIRLYGDSRLTDQIGEIALDDTGKDSVLLPSARRAAPQQAVGDSEINAEITVKPLDFPRVMGRVLIDPAGNIPRLRDANIRYFNLILLNEMPELIETPDAAIRLAEQNLVGLTRPDNKWAGDTEFESRRNEDHFRKHGATQVLELAKRLDLPQEIVVRHAAQLDKYDFERQGFPIRLRKDALDRVSGFSATDSFGREIRTDVVQGAMHEAIAGSVSVMWRKRAGPAFWPVSSDAAQSVVNEHPTQPTGWRQIYIGMVARLHRLVETEQGGPTFEGELLKVGLYWDAELTEDIATQLLSDN